MDVKENHAFAQAWFLPSYPPERAELFKTYSFIDGHGLDVDKITADYQKHLARLISLEPDVPIASKVERLQSVPNGTNPIAAFNADFAAHDVLIRNGYKQQGKRYLHPNSSSKIAGVRILDNGRVYSDSNDILNDGKAHDSFDCFRLLECGGDMKAALNWNADLTKANQRAFYAN
jgi:hypothetical protein